MGCSVFFRVLMRNLSTGCLKAFIDGRQDVTHYVYLM